MPAKSKRVQNAMSADNGKNGGNMKSGLAPSVGRSIARMLRFRDCSCKLPGNVGKNNKYNNI